MTLNDFLQSFEALRAYADTATFEDVENSADGVVYPKICEDIPGECRDEILQRLAILKGEPLAHCKLFMRLSPKGVHVPHQAHTDNVMGTGSLMLYLNREEHCAGGTALVRHKASGITYAPEDDAYVDLVRADANNPDAWEIVEAVPMLPNRAFIFDARLFHRAEPLGGFGFTPANARLVLTAFFS